MDIHVPELGSVHTLEAVKNDKDLRKMPVIVLSESDDEPILQAFQQSGCSMFLVKPSDPSEFSEMIQKIGDFISIIEAPCFVKKT